MYEISENVEENNQIRNKYLTFLTDGQTYGVPVLKVVQILGMQEITSIPGLPRCFKGTINLRGDVIPLIDLRLILNKHEIPGHDRNCVIAANIKGRHMGLIVEKVEEVMDIPEESLSPDTGDSPVSAAAKLGNKTVFIMNLDKILSEAEFKAMADSLDA